MVALAGVTRGGEVGREAGNPNLRVEVADVGGGVLVALCRVLSEQVRAHARRDARRHGWVAPAARRAASGGGGELLTGRGARGGGEVRFS
jgi:hypothetical protein